MSSTTTRSITKHGEDLFSIYETTTYLDTPRVDYKEIGLLTMDQIDQRISDCQAQLDRWTQIKTTAEGL